MKKVFESVVRVANRVFHNRKIVIVSEGKATTISFSRNFQIVTVLLIVAAISWVPFSAGKIVAFSHLSDKKVAIKDLSTVEQRVDVLQNDILLLEEYLRALHKYDNFELNSNKYTAKAANRQGPEELSELEEKRDEIMVDLKRRTLTRIFTIENFLKSAGLNYAKITGKKQLLASDEEAGVGGPYIPASLEDIQSKEQDTQMSAEFIDELNYLFELQKIVNNLPFSNPVAYNKISSPFGVRHDPFNGRLAMHSGIDLAGNPGAGVAATGPGKVTFAGRKGAYGLMVEIDHGYGYLTRYGHLASATVKEGDYVSRGRIIGRQGCSGRCTGSHVHYEVRVNNSPVNPWTYLAKANEIQYYYAKKF